MLYRFPKNVMSPLMVNRLVRFFSTVTYAQQNIPLSGRNTSTAHPKLMPVTSNEWFRRHAVTMPTPSSCSAGKLVQIIPTNMTLTGNHVRAIAQLQGYACRKTRSSGYALPCTLQ